jgi:hypothetical protein
MERLRELTEVSGDEIAELRRSVMERVNRPRRSPWWLAAAAAALIGAAAIGWQARAPVETLVLRMPSAPAAPAVAFTPRPVVEPPVLKRAPSPKPESRASVIKIYTDDPDVVILLVGGEE